MRHGRGYEGSNRADDHHEIHSCERCKTEIVVNRETGKIASVVRGNFVPTKKELNKKPKKEKFYREIKPRLEQ